MEYEKTLPLLNIAQSYLNDSNNFMSTEVKEKAMQIFQKLISLDLPPESAKAQLMNLNISISAFNKIMDILNTPAQPIIPKTDISISTSSIKKKKLNNWSKYEDQRLIAGVHIYGLDNWALIAKFVGNNRTRAQCSQRWNRGLNPLIKKSHWSDEEEEKLLKLVEQYGSKSWTKIAEQMVYRCDVQCRYHYIQMAKENKRGVSITEKVSEDTCVSTPNEEEIKKDEKVVIKNTPVINNETINTDEKLNSNKFFQKLDDFWDNLQDSNVFNDLFIYQDSNELDF